MAFDKTVHTRCNGVLNYIISKMIYGILEGIHSKIQLIKLRARSYQNTTNFINEIYFTYSKLIFDYSQYST